MASYLVTGAAGFIGGALANRLLRNGHRVITIDNLSTGYKANIPSDCIFLEGDCHDHSIINQLNGYSFDAIFHIAGQSSGEISFDSPVSDLKANTQSTLELLKYAKEVGCKKFIYASTMSVYGVQPDEKISEDILPCPTSFYGVGKLASEHYLRLYSKFGIATSSARLFNVYGPGQNMENMRQGMVSIFLSLALKNKRIHVKGDSKRYRDFIYIDDVIDAFLKLLEINHGNNCFNICTGVRTTVGNLIKEIQNELPFEVVVTYKGSTLGDLFGIVGDNSKILNELNFAPNIVLSDGLNRMIKRVLNHGN